MITPHLSTGGQPQYLLKQIEHYIGEYEIFCVEHSNITGGVLVVQRNRISNILGDRLITLGEDKSAIVNIINEICPDIIHFQEIPETFFDAKTLDVLYAKEREYSIVVTTHSSHTNPAAIKYTADRFVLVSEWSRKKFAEVFGDDMCRIWEYPVVVDAYDKSQAKRDLGFDEEYAHVLHVGLFTPGKNQKEIIEIAKMCEGEKIVFHFVGNQAENFRAYWEPLMKDFPKNCVWHNERSDADRFYRACDLFYFPSLFELNPISVKEAVGYGLKVFLRKLDTYEDTYDGVATYTGDDISANCELLKRALPQKKEIPGWFSCGDIYDLFVGESTDGSRIVEIGSWFGKSTDYLITQIKKSGKSIKLDVIDTFKGSPTPQYADVLASHDGDIYQNFCDNMQEYEGLSVIKDYSSDASGLYQNGGIDFLMIDGDQSYEGVKSDLRDFYYKVRPGGIIAGDACGFRLEGNEVKTAVDEFFMSEKSYRKFDKSGGYNWWHRRPKIQVIHVSTLPTQKRAEKSKMNIDALRAYGIDIKYIQNDAYTGEVNLETYRNRGNLHNVRPSHYGCYLGHTQALTEIEEQEYNYTVIMEEDAYIYTGIREFVDALHRAIFACERDNGLAYVSFGSDVWQSRADYDEMFDEAWHQILAHCYLIPSRHKSWYMQRIAENRWDSADLWYNQIFASGDRKRLVSKKTFSKQLNGMSIIDGVYKDYTNGKY